MADFYIAKLRISGDGKETSVVDFTDGLNIVCGPSNTGKSYIVEIIDFLFGSSRVPFDKTLGYDTFEMVIKTIRGTITVRRQMDARKINVTSSDRRIESGDYGTTSGKLNVNEDLWFKLMGIEDKHEEIDEIIASHLKKGWTLSRISKPSLAILRLAIYEMKYLDNVPQSVSINEAVELAKKYTIDESKFVNGILGTYSREISGKSEK